MGIPSRMDGRCVINGGWGGAARAEVNVRIVTRFSFYVFQNIKVMYVHAPCTATVLPPPAAATASTL